MDEKKRIIIKKLLKLFLILVIIGLTFYAAVKLLELKSTMEENNKDSLPGMSGIY